LLYENATLCPKEHKCKAIARPIPLLPPVTKIVDNLFT